MGVAHALTTSEVGDMPIHARALGNGARIGLGLAAVGRPAYINLGRDSDLGGHEDRTVAAMEARAHRLLDQAWDADVRYFDAARSYGYAERFLGTWLREHPDRRPQLVLGSKWGYEYVGDWRMDAALHERKDHSLEMLSQQWPESLQALGGVPDIYYIHSVTPESPALGDAGLLDRLRELAGTGIRIGLSTSGPDQASVIERALSLSDGPFQAVESTWNVLEQAAGDALDRAHAAGWSVVVKEALANGRLADAAQKADVDTDSASNSAAPGLAVARAAAHAGLSIQAFAFGVALAQPWASSVLSGAVTKEQLAEGLAVQPLEVAAEQLAALAVVPETYWKTRSNLSWA